MAERRAVGGRAAALAFVLLACGGAASERDLVGATGGTAGFTGGGPGGARAAAGGSGGGSSTTSGGAESSAGRQSTCPIRVVSGVPLSGSELTGTRVTLNGEHLETIADSDGTGRGDVVAVLRTCRDSSYGYLAFHVVLSADANRMPGVLGFEVSFGDARECAVSAFFRGEGLDEIPLSGAFDLGVVVSPDGTNHSASGSAYLTGVDASGGPLVFELELAIGVQVQVCLI